MADWSGIAKRCQIDVIDRPLQVPDEAARVLAPYDIVCMLRERTAGPRSLIEKLPNLKLLAITGLQHRTLDVAAATDRGILVCHSSRACRRAPGHARTRHRADARRRPTAFRRKIAAPARATGRASVGIQLLAARSALSGSAKSAGKSRAWRTRST